MLSCMKKFYKIASTILAIAWSVYLRERHTDAIITISNLEDIPRCNAGTIRETNRAQNRTIHSKGAFLQNAPLSSCVVSGDASVLYDVTIENH